jgi:hypothetical protein
LTLEFWRASDPVMANTVSTLASIVRSLVSLAVLGLVGTGGWFAYNAYSDRAALDRELAARTAEVERLTAQNQKLGLALRLLKVDHRVAQIEVLDQTPGPERPKTRFRFVELATDGNPIGEPKEFTIDGSMVYIDAWVIKYADDLVERGDPLRSTSVCLFRRIFGEYQEPSEGFPLDAAGSRPAVYSQGNEMSALERDIWANFWQYANDPARAKVTGVRAAHGEAPSIRLEPLKRYRIELRASAGLTIVAEDVPPKPAG